MFLFNAGIKCEFFTINICFAREYENRRSLGQTDSLQMWWILIYGGGQQRRGTHVTLSGFPHTLGSGVVEGMLAMFMRELPPPPPQPWTMAVETNQNVTGKQRDLRGQFKRRNIREGCRNLIFPTCNTRWHDTWYICACSRNGRK